MKRSILGALAALTATMTLSVVAGTVGTAAAAGGNGCPSNKVVAGLPTATNVGASFSNSGSTTTYTFSSLSNENPSGGVPGLIKYCVYPSPTSQPTSISVLATGANGKKWISSKGSNNFAFVRPGGDKTNIPLDGKTTTMGTATWNSVPQDQTIVLHINDPAVCTSLYGLGTPATCFVKPSTGPVCDKGDTNVAYNAMPFDVVHCPKPSEAFEAQTVSEFGDGVTLKSGTPRTLDSLKVLFASYGCSDSGHWFGDGTATNPYCVTTPGATFAHPITATIYEVATGAACGSNPSPCPGNVIDQVTVNQVIPYRPSADTVNCPGTGKWFDALAPVGSQCQDKVSTVLTFSFTGNKTLPDDIIWTVAFNTTHYGSPPIGEATTCFQATVGDPTAPGCGYDSLNVGAKSFAGAPYAGTDDAESAAYLNAALASSTVGYCDGGTAGVGFLRLDAGCWTGFRPLGEVITQAP